LNRPKPSDARHACTAALASRTITSAPLARPANSANDVGHRLASGRSAPRSRQAYFSGRGKGAQIRFLDQMLCPGALRAKAARPNPAPNGFGVAAKAAGSLGNGQHGSSILQHSGVFALHLGPRGASATR
jgi:hypothetical protein